MKKILVSSIIGSVFMVGCATTQVQSVSTINAPKALGPYSQAVRAGNSVYLSGQIAIDPTTGNLVSDQIEEQTLQVMKNLKAVLEASNLTFDNVVSTTIYVKNISDFNVVNAEYAKSFNKVLPSRATVQVANLPKNALVEISMIAVK